MVDQSIRALDQSRLGAILTGDARGAPRRPAGHGHARAEHQSGHGLPRPAPGARRACAREDLFLCVHEQFMTETAAFADIVLPATTFVEHDDFYTASGHTYFQVTKKVIEPPGECRENHAVICDLAKRLGATHRGFEMTRVGDHGRDARAAPACGTRETNWRRGGQDTRRPFEKAHFLDGFETPDRKFHFKPDWARFGGRWARDARRCPITST